MYLPEISIHAPPRGATLHGVRHQPRYYYFNSRPSARGDQRRTSVQRGINISIHAPPRGATRLVEMKTQEMNISIHAPPRGATPPNQRHFRAFCNFNSRPSARGDSAARIWKFRHTAFQFTPLREGRQGTIPVEFTAHQISIHAPPRGATGEAQTVIEAQAISIHAPPRGATRLPLRLRRGRRYFNSRPSARGDTSALAIATGQKVFQFTPLREGRRTGTQPPF